MPAILPDLSALSADQLRAMVLAMAEQSTGNRPITCKVSEKGALSIYGLSSRFPVTLYKSQFDRLDAAWPQVQAFVKANAPRFSAKPPKA